MGKIKRKNSQDVCPRCGSTNLHWDEYYYDQIKKQFRYSGDCFDCGAVIVEVYGYKKSIAYDDPAY